VILVILILILIFGLFLGSFLGVLVDRIPRNETVVKGHSHCEFCKKELAWYDLIPVWSFLITRGRCRYCKRSLSIFYPVIEITTGLMFAATCIFVSSQFTISLFYYLLIISSFIVIFFTDLRYGIIPDKILLPTIVVSLLYQLFINPSSFIINLFCGIGAFLFFITVSVIFSALTKKDAMGGGDIKLAFLLGLILGFPNIIVSLYLAFLTGAFVGIILIIWKKKSFRGATLPFGPFLILGAVISLFWGNFILQKLIVFLGI
jgi:leader peptidase (prepilin peptidase)/N-methyltransferase